MSRKPGSMHGLRCYRRNSSGSVVSNSGSAYDASEFTGDDGVAGAFELRYSPPLTIPTVASELFTFYDIGRVWNYNDIKNSQFASSAGFGLRLNQGDHISGNITIAKPLNAKVAAPNSGDGMDPRVFFSLNVHF